MAIPSAPASRSHDIAGEDSLSRLSAHAADVDHGLGRVGEQLEHVQPARRAIEGGRPDATAALRSMAEHARLHLVPGQEEVAVDVERGVGLGRARREATSGDLGELARVVEDEPRRKA